MIKTILYFFSAIIASANEILPDKVLSLKPGYYYFLGSETGWAKKSKASYGVVNHFNFFVPEISDGNFFLKYYRDTVKNEDEGVYSIEFKWEVVSHLDSKKQILFSRKDIISLDENSDLRALTDKPYLSYQENSPYNVEVFEDLEVIKYPYLKINNISQSSVIAFSKKKEEIINFIRIPPNYYFFEWRFKSL